MVLLLVIVVLLVKDCSKPRNQDATLKEYQLLKEKLKDDSSAMVVFMAKDSTRAVQLEGLQASNESLLKELFDLESVAKKYNMELKDIKGVLKTRIRDTVTIVQDTGKVKEERPNDSTILLTTTFTNRWYTAKTRVSNRPALYPGSMTLTTEDSLLYIFGRKKKGNWFNRSYTPTVTIIHANPYVKERGAQYVEVPNAEKRKRWHLGPYGGVNIINGKPATGAGVGIMYSLISW